MIAGDTIAAVASCPGWSARAIVRASGPATTTIHDAVLRDVRPMPSATRGPRARSVELLLGPGPRLPALAISWRAPGSYTGEDSLEVYVPGNPHLARRVLDAFLVVPGVRLARPGEFSERAYWNGRLSLEQAEGLAGVLAARTARDLDAARRVMSGAEGAQAAAIADQTATLLSLVEAGIDFSDQEDVGAITPATLRAGLERAIGAIDAMLAPAPARAASEATPVIVLAGAPNAGKSTLFNAILGRARAAESPEPGTTRDAIAETVELVPDAWVTLVDLPGLEIGSPRDEAEREAQRAARARLEAADLIVRCDPRGRFTTALPPGIPVLDVRTKADLDEPCPAPRSVCARWPESVAELRRAIAFAIDRSASADEQPVLARRRESLTQARRDLDAALACLRADRVPGERAALLLRTALDALGGVTGRVHPDEIIGRIFRTFCVGK